MQLLRMENKKTSTSETLAIAHFEKERWPGTRVSERAFMELLRRRHQQTSWDDFLELTTELQEERWVRMW